MIEDFNLGNDTSMNNGAVQPDYMENEGDENDSVYIKDNIEMRRIQIEGED